MTNWSFDPEVAAGYQDADIETAEFIRAAAEASEREMVDTIVEQENDRARLAEARRELAQAVEYPYAGDPGDGDRLSDEIEQLERRVVQPTPPGPPEHFDPGAHGCDNCGKVAELYHNEATGLSFCDACDRLAEQPVTWKRLRNGAWGVTGPSGLLLSGATVVVTKRSGATKTVTVSRVLWSGDGKAIATVRR